MITSGIETTNNITYKIKDQEPRLIITHGSNENSDQYLTTGVLCKDLEQKFRLFLTKNGYDDWSAAGVFVIKDGTPSSEYAKIASSLQNKIAEKEFFGVWYGDNHPLNLAVDKKKTSNLKLSDGPIEV